MSDDRASLAIKVLESLSWPRILLAAASGITGVVLLYVYEQRASAIPALLENNLAMFGLVLSLMLGVIGAVGGRMLQALQARVEQQQVELHTYLRTELESVREAHRKSMQREIELSAELASVRRRLTVAEAALRKAGLSTDFGDI